MAILETPAPVSSKSASMPAPAVSAPLSLSGQDKDLSYNSSRAAAWDSGFHAFEAKATLGLSPFSLGFAMLDWSLHLANAPFRRVELAELAFQQAIRFVEAAGNTELIKPAPGDHRFNAPEWHRQPFSTLAQGFLLAEEWWAAAADGGPGMGRTNQRIASFTIRQLVDMFSPSNIPWLNPEVLQASFATKGRNLVAGAVNLANDAQRMLGSKPNSEGGYQIGKDLAATPGKVVFRNELIELIQYTPVTTQVAREPILIIPAWIMKYYILDLSPGNSLINYLVTQGHTVFAISWRNPRAELHDLSFDDYRVRGAMAAIEAVSDICGDVKIHACGYCLGGTLLTVTAAAMARDGDHRLASVTLFCAQTDFTEAGELQLFITEDQLAFLDDVMTAQGYLDSSQMAGAFQLLRSNDLVWSRAIKGYLLGLTEHPSDLMAWNADGTRMPARMHSEYLHRLFLNNELAEGRFMAGNQPVAVSDIHAPLFVVATETDHIAPWRSVYKIHLLNDWEITFVLASGGHNAGVVSEPGHPNRHFRIGARPAGDLYVAPDQWAEDAERRDGSWWLAWAAWLRDRSSGNTAPPETGSARYPVLGPAPGTYVHER